MLNDAFGEAACAFASNSELTEIGLNDFKNLISRKKLVILQLGKFPIIEDRVMKKIILSALLGAIALPAYADTTDQKWMTIVELKNRACIALMIRIVSIDTIQKFQKKPLQTLAI